MGLLVIDKITLFRYAPSVTYAPRLSDDDHLFEQRVKPIGEKVREALVHVIRQADRLGVRVTQYEILKTLFFADRRHLTVYGRPITFDQYEALPDGPVPSLSYDVLKGALYALRHTGINEPLWEIEPAGGNKKHFLNAARDASDDVLSESDMEELESALAKVHAMTFQQIWDESHDDPAYKAAWGRRGSSRASLMRYHELLGGVSGERLKDVFAHAEGY